MKVTINRGRALLPIKQSTESILIARSLEGRCFWKSNGLSFHPSAHNFRMLLRKIPELELPSTRRTVPPLETLRGVRHRPWSKPYPYQADIFKQMKTAPGSHLALFCEQGTGKSKIAIDWMEWLHCRREIDRCLIVAPKGVHAQWAESQLPQHGGIVAWVDCWKGISDPGPDPWNPPSLQVRCINYEALRTPSGRGWVEEWLDEGQFLLVLDESHRVKNASSKIWNACYEIAQKPTCVRRLLLSGTPIAKNLIDEWAQLRILDSSILGMDFKATFIAGFCIVNHYKQVIGARNIAQFKQLTAPYIFRATKADLPGLPPKVYKEFVFEMGAHQRKLCRQVASEIIVKLKEGQLTVQQAVSRMGKMQQISSGFLILDGGIVSDVHPKGVPDPRLEALKSVLQDHDGKTVVWCHYTLDVERVAREWAGASAMYYGPMSPRERQLAREAWLDPESEIRLLVATPGSGGTGLNLQGECQHAIYYSHSTNAVDRWQSEDRIHRIGTKGSHTLYTSLIGKGSMDRRIMANLKEKKSLSDMTLDDVASAMDEVVDGLCAS